MYIHERHPLLLPASSIQAELCSHVVFPHGERFLISFWGLFHGLALMGFVMHAEGPWV
jgi:hypothetical protein